MNFSCYAHSFFVFRATSAFSANIRQEDESNDRPVSEAGASHTSEIHFRIVPANRSGDLFTHTITSSEWMGVTASFAAPSVAQREKAL
ncbi:hypothetical protein NPIL_162061 [Nephila pilipes]|uniref:Uncharacterized protein n=1 Tax=Nephila pilipes TaxID=299642 RepID=A0A8X6PKC7_NEPPI|nr:hypothetical protein NPIL_162061 [Nephila pilipes]